MAAKPLDPAIAEAIVRDWRTGEYSQRQLADIHKVSTGKVANLTKGVTQDASSIVSAGIQYKQGLSAHDERMVSAITHVVDKKVQRLEWLRDAAMQNVQQAMQAPCESQHEFRARGETITKAVETVDPKGAATTAIQINNGVQKIERVIV